MKETCLPIAKSGAQKQENDGITSCRGHFGEVFDSVV